MPSDQFNNKKESEKTGAKTSGQSASTEIRVTSQNLIKSALHSSTQGYKFVSDNLNKLPQAQRIGALALAGFILFWPLFTFVMIVPWIFAGLILAYSLLLGFETLVNHTEEALLSELALSPANADRVKELAKGLRDNYQSVGKSMLEKGYNAALIVATSSSAVLLQYAQKALNYVISNLQQAKEKTDATSDSVNEKAENLKKSGKAAPSVSFMKSQ